MKAIRCTFLRIAIVAMSISPLFSIAAPAENALTGSYKLPRDFVGIQLVGTNYPDGWKQIASDGFGRSPYIMTTITKGPRHILLLEKKVGETKINERLRVVVADAISVTNPTNPLKFARLCYFEGQEATKNEANILANVRFARYCDMKTRIIRRAWKINLEAGKFEPIQDTKKLICEYGFVSNGDTDFREGCPTYGLR